MDTNTGSGKVKMIKEFNNWIVDKTTSEPNLDEKIELKLDSITSQVKKVSLYPDELEMEVIKTTNIDVNKVVNECWILRPSGHSLERLSEKEKTTVFTKFKTDNISFRVLSLRFRNRINDNQIQFEYLNVLFDQDGDYSLLADHTNVNDVSVNAESSATYVIEGIVKDILKEMDSEPVIEKSKTDNNKTLYMTKEEFANIMPSGRKDFMEHNLEWIEKTHKEDFENIKNDQSLSSTDKAESLKEIETEYAKRIEDVKRDGECRFK
ncbi:hypothetical protein [Flavobacterium sp. CG_9.10]|nr:hypothetical protein [Flavobacterium sp. CG_9.10]